MIATKLEGPPLVGFGNESNFSSIGKVISIALMPFWASISNRSETLCNVCGPYIKSTYGQHYSTTEDGFQVQDMLRQLDIDKDFCQANAIKYLCRYGKKDGKNRKDLLKAIHYIVLLMSSEDNK